MMWKVQWAKDGERDVSSLAELEALLDDLQRKYRRSRPALITIEAPENQGTLTIGLGLDVSVLNHIPESGNPPYLSSLGNPNAEGITVFYYMGDWTEIHQRHLIPIDLAREGVRHFCKTGHLLDKIEWEED